MRVGPVQDSDITQAALPSPTTQPLQTVQQAAWAAAVPLPPVRLQPALVIVVASWQRYSLPLRKPLTTGALLGQRGGFLLRLTAQPDGKASHVQGTAGHATLNGTKPSAAGGEVMGVGEVCALPLMCFIYSSMHNWSRSTCCRAALHAKDGGILA